MNNPRSVNAGQPAKLPPSQQKRAWVIGIAILGALLFLLISAEFIIHYSLHKGWTRYDNNVTALAVDPQGQVWAAVSDGNITSLMLYSDDNASVQDPLPNELAGVTVQSMAIDRQNRVWVGTINGFIGMRDIKGQWTLYTPENLQGENPYPVWDLVIDGHDQAWARYATRLVKLDPAAGNSTYMLGNSGLPENHVDGIAVDEKGQLWAINFGGLMVLGPDNAWTTYTFAPNAGLNLPMDGVLAFDHEGRIWLALNSGIAAIGLDGAWQTYAVGDPTLANIIKDIVVDDQGRVWAASDYQGLFRFDPDYGWTTYNQRSSGLSRNSATSLALDGQGRLWMGTFNGELNRFDPDAALPVQNIQALNTLAVALVPAALISIALVMVLGIAFTRPGAANSRNILDFSMAFIGWFVINSLLVVYVRATASHDLFIDPIALLPMAVTIVGMIILLLTRRWMALGAFSAFVVNAIGMVLVTSQLGGICSMLPFFMLLIISVGSSNYRIQKFTD